MMQSMIRMSVCLFAAVVLESRGCSDIEIPDGVIEDRVPSDSVRVRFVNQSTWALGAQLHVSAESGDPDTVLFVEENHVTADIGFAGQGFIPPGDTDEILIRVENAAMIGTLGGAFVDRETGELAGNGQRRVLQRDLQYEGGDTITFIYRAALGEFSTSLLLN